MKEVKTRYKTRPIRMADETWKRFKQEKIKSGKSWNLFIITKLEKNGKVS